MSPADVTAALMYTEQMFRHQFPCWMLEIITIDSCVELAAQNKKQPWSKYRTHHGLDGSNVLCCLSFNSSRNVKINLYV